jgi:dienelactone hydrolase
MLGRAPLDPTCIFAKGEAQRGMTPGAPMLFSVRFVLLMLLGLLFSGPAADAADYAIDGVPVPVDAAVQAKPTAGLHAHWLGAWTGAWDETLKHILIVESVADDGQATAIYAVGDNPSWRIKQQWHRYAATVAGEILTLNAPGFSATYQLTKSMTLHAQFERGPARSQAILARSELAALLKPDAKIAWLSGIRERVLTDLVEDSQAINLEVVLFKPPGVGPFPLAVLNHGSTGEGNKPALFAETWSHVGLAAFLNDRGWMVAFPQRRGRGQSDGLYAEGFARDRSQGYTCETETALAGADRALQDIAAAVSALRRRSDVAPQPILIGGQSRGGVLSVAYAGIHPEHVAGVVNFVGGWVGDTCKTAANVNGSLFQRGARFGHPTLWLYGLRDPFYSTTHSRQNFAAFEQTGGRGSFSSVEVPGGHGHFLISHPKLWSQPLTRYLDDLPKL